MKASTIIAAAILSLQAGILFAGNENTSAPVTNENMTISIVALAPAPPAEATFEEIEAVDETLVFAPVTPSEATFGDEYNEQAPVIGLAPSTPATADFE
ncbi:MAG: hypothetical protein WCK34_08790 [Bacteroidota bacterium]